MCVYALLELTSNRKTCVSFMQWGASLSIKMISLYLNRFMPERWLDSGEAITSSPFALDRRDALQPFSLSAPVSV